MAYNLLTLVIFCDVSDNLIYSCATPGAVGTPFQIIGCRMSLLVQTNFSFGVGFIGAVVTFVYRIGVVLQQRMTLYIAECSKYHFTRPAFIMTPQRAAH